jgi:hypothetical protein
MQSLEYRSHRQAFKLPIQRIFSWLLLVVGLLAILGWVRSYYIWDDVLTCTRAPLSSPTSTGDDQTERRLYVGSHSGVVYLIRLHSTSRFFGPWHINRSDTSVMYSRYHPSDNTSFSSPSGEDVFPELSWTHAGFMRVRSPSWLGTETYTFYAVPYWAVVSATLTTWVLLHRQRLKRVREKKGVKSGSI